MEKFFSLILPFFLVIGLGYVSGRRAWLPREALAGLNAFVVLFAVPSLIFDVITKAPSAQIANLDFIFAYGGTSLGVFLLAYLAISLTLKLGRFDTTYNAQATAMPNSGYLGIPMIHGLLGPIAAVTVVVCVIIEMLLIAPIASLVAGARTRRHNKKQRSRLSQVGRQLQGMLSNPLLIATLIALIINFASIPVPSFASATIGILAQGAGPAALLAVGLALAIRQMDIKRERREEPTDVNTPNKANKIARAAILIACFRLFVHPALAYLSLYHLYPLPEPFAATGVLVACLPVATNAYLLAERAKAETASISSAILISSAVALFTFTLMQAVLL